MFYITIIIIVFRIFLAFCYFLYFQNDEPVLSWNESYRLLWADTAKPNNSLSVIAITASGITFGFLITQTYSSQAVDFSINVHAHFYPEQSWYKKELANSHVLGHEQLHFYITELHPRKFIQHISQLSVSNSIRKELKQIHNNTFKELELTQNKYDAETDYSRNFEVQTI